MASLRVFKLAADGRLDIVDLSRERRVPDILIHPHRFEHFTHGRPLLFITDPLKNIANHVLSQRIDADIVHVGIGDPASCKEGEAIEQAVYIAPKGQRKLMSCGF